MRLTPLSIKSDVNLLSIANEKIDRPPREKCVEEAIDWMVAMKAGDMSQADFTSFQKWQLLEENAAAWAKMSRSLGPFSLIAATDPIDRALSHRVLSRPRSRRNVVSGFCAFAGTLGSVALANRYVPLRNLFADDFTLTAQNKSVALPDGSRLVLAPRTAVDVRYSPTERLIALEGGTTLATAATGRDRPFFMRGARLLARTDGGRFMMTTASDDQSVIGVDGETEVRSDGGESMIALKGDRVSLRSRKLVKSYEDLETAICWVDGLIVARDQNVAEVVEKFRPYFAGVIVVDPAIAAIRVTGVFPLSDPRNTIEAMAASLGLVASSPTPFWISIGPATRGA